MLWRICLLLPLVACLVAVPSRAADDEAAEALKTDLATLKSANFDTDNEGLIKFFKNRTLGKDKRDKIEKYIVEMGDKAYMTREKATEGLVQAGAVARPLLANAALRNADPEVRRRANRALRKIGPAAAEAHLLPAAARVLASKKPAGAAKILLDYIPNVEQAEVAYEVMAPLVDLVKDKAGKIDNEFLLAVKDAHPVKRLAAGEAITRSKATGSLAIARNLLKDKDVNVRRRIALALAELKDKDSIPVLISLLTQTNVDDFGTVEDMLVSIAGDKAPEAPDTDDEKGRATYQKSWEKWYKDAGAKLDLTKLDLTSSGSGYTLVSTLDTNYSTGKVTQYTSSGKQRWQIKNLQYPICASMSRSDRVLVCEYYGNKVTERSTKGTTIWTKTFQTQVVCAHKVAGGKLFVATRNQLIVYDRSNKQIASISRPSYDVYSAWYYPKDGSFAIISNGSTYIKLDKNGTQTKSFYIGAYLSSIGVKCHFTKKGGVIVPDYSRNAIREYDVNGKEVKSYTVNRPNSVCRTSNGQFIVGSRMDSKVYVLDKSGKQIKTITTDGRPLFAERR